MNFAPIEFRGEIKDLTPEKRREIAGLFKESYEEIPAKVIKVYRDAPLFIEEDGAHRHQMTREYLESLYKSIEDFIADCSYNEYKENIGSIHDFLALLHKRINESE